MKLTASINPIEDTWEERFGFLDQEARDLALACFNAIAADAPLSYPRTRKTFDALVELVRELVIHIDLEADWEIHKDKSPTQIEQELRAAGMDPDAMFDKFRARMAEEFGFTNIKSAAEYEEARRKKAEREYRQLFGQA